MKHAEVHLVNLLPMLEPIQDELGAVETRMLAVVRETYEPLSSALRAILVSGGKRLRPALVILAARLHRWDPEPVTNLAAAVELLHTATLIHDDTIDEALVRRGHRTLNATWSRAATILAGDLMFARAAALAAETGNIRVASIFARTLATICEGELRQMLSLFDWRGGHEGYYQRTHSKTASLFASASEAGAILGQASEERIRALREYGQHLGMAFQIVDDILDFVGDERYLGKPVGSDLRQGTATLPVYHYLQAGGDEGLVEAALDRGARRGQAVAELVAAIASSPAIDTCQQEAHAFARRAVDALAILDDGPYRQALCDLAGFVVARQT
jgi:geranylgeranyl pyrophosphate synthase